MSRMTGPDLLRQETLASQKLPGAIATPVPSSLEVPRLHLSLRQMEQASRSLAKLRESSIPSLDANSGSPMNVGLGQEATAAFFLAKGGVDADQLSKNVEEMANHLPREYAFEQAMSSLDSADLTMAPMTNYGTKQWFNEARENMIFDVLEDLRDRARIDAQDRIVKRLQRRWEDDKQVLLDRIHSGRSIISFNSDDAVRSMGDGPKTQSQRVAGRENDGYAGDTFAKSRAPKRAQKVDSAGKIAPKPAELINQSQHYLSIIQSLNQARLEGRPLAICNLHADAVRRLGEGLPTTKNESSGLWDLWNLLSNMVGEREVAQGSFLNQPILEGQYTDAYASQDCPEKSALKTMLAQNARHWLENQYRRHIDRTIAAKPKEADIGGIPSVIAKTAGYLRIKFSDQKTAGGDISRIYFIDDKPIWAMIYTLMRAGHDIEVRDFIYDFDSAIAQVERNFSLYAKAYFESSAHELPKSLRDRFMAEYNQRIRYLSEYGDPFLVAIYKIIGRTDLQRRSLPVVAATTEDWLWLQFALIKEDIDLNGRGDDSIVRYTLQDLQVMLQRYGQSHFDPSGTKTLFYCQILLLSAQFEHAIDFLYSSGYFLDATHLAICLAYYGLLRITPRTKESNDKILTHDEMQSSRDIAYCNLGKLLFRQSREYTPTRPEDALQYLFLLCIPRGLTPVEDEYTKLCHQLIKDLCLETRRWSMLGQFVHYSFQPGIISTHRELIRLGNNEDFVTSIVLEAAIQSESGREIADAVQLYDLAGRYQEVIRLLVNELGDALQTPDARQMALKGKNLASNVLGNGSSSLPDKTALVPLAHTLSAHYDTCSEIMKEIDPKMWEALQLLLAMFEIYEAQAEGAFDKVIELIQATGLVPISPDISTMEITRQADRQIFSLDNALIRNVPNLILVAMSAIYESFSSSKNGHYTDQGALNSRLHTLREMSRRVMTFAGLLRFRMSAETFAQCAKLDVFLH